MNHRVLYITYDGLLDPLGQSQVQPYLRWLGRAGVRMRVLSFEKPERLDRLTVARTRSELAACGVAWTALRYHSRPAAPATAWDILRGVIVGLWLALLLRADTVHVRSYIAALIALPIIAFPRRRFLFDMRGFWADEKVEGGAWHAGGAMYRLFKRLESVFLGRADAVVVLSERGAALVRTLLPPGRSRVPVAVIPTCTDLELFRPDEMPLPAMAERRGLNLVYLGSLGTWYLPVEMLRFFGALLEKYPESGFRFISGAPEDELKAAVAESGLTPQAAARVSLGPLPRESVPAALARADFSIFFIRPSFSKQASCATKFGESMACGVPVLINSGIGDHDTHVETGRVGLVLEDLSPDSFHRALESIPTLLADPGLRLRCRALAENLFSLERAGQTYLELYGEL